MKTPQVPVAQEGYPFIFLSGFVTLVFALTGEHFIAYLGVVVTAFILSFFRDPERIIPEKPHAVVSPADGKVIFVGKVQDDDYLQKEVFKISVFMNVFNVHVNRIPITGEVKKIDYRPGKFYSADSDRGMLHNESCATIIEKNGVEIVCVQVAGLIARRIVNWLDVGDEIKKGERFGLIRFGSRVDVYLPSDIAIAIEKGQKIKAGETILGYLNS